MSADSTKEKAIYGTGEFIGNKAAKVKLGPVDTRISVLKFEWMVSCEVKEDKFMISAKMQSRYVFSDSQYLEIYLENKGTEIKQQKFKLEKTSDKQVFEIAYDKNSPIGIKDVDVFAVLAAKSMNYFSNDWATESDFKDIERAHDVVLLVGETKFYVHRNYLATWSRYFDRLFFGNFKEKNQTEVKLEEVDPKDFENLLYYIHPQLNWEIEEDDVLKTLELADRFEIPNIMARCGTFLCDFDNCDDMEIIDRLELGEKYKLIHLQIACFEHIHNLPSDEYHEFFAENRDRIKKMSDLTVRNLI